MPELPPADLLTGRIARCIGIWETNRGGDEPKPIESRLDTVCGIRASIATIEQATMPYTVEAFRRFGFLRERASPLLKEAEIAKAEACCAAVKAPMPLVEAASARSDSLESFAKDNEAALKTARFRKSDLPILFRAAVLKRSVVTLNEQVTAGSLTLDEAVTRIAEGERMKLGPGSLKAYIRRPANWGENRAAWQRLAVSRLPGRIGERMEAVAVTKGGTALVMPVLAERIRAALAGEPLDEQQLVTSVAQANNPNEPGYGENVFKIYRRLYLKEEAGFFEALFQQADQAVERVLSLLTRDELSRLRDRIVRRLGNGEPS